MGLGGDACLGFSALFLPPLPVLIRTGCSGWLLGCIIATLFAWVPGIFFAFLVIALYPPGAYRREKKLKRAKTYPREEIIEYEYFDDPPRRRSKHKSRRYDKGYVEPAYYRR